MLHEITVADGALMRLRSWSCGERFVQLCEDCKDNNSGSLQLSTVINLKSPTKRLLNNKQVAYSHNRYQDQVSSIHLRMPFCTRAPLMLLNRAVFSWEAHSLIHCDKSSLTFCFHQSFHKAPPFEMRPYRFSSREL